MHHTRNSPHVTGAQVTHTDDAPSAELGKAAGVSVVIEAGRDITVPEPENPEQQNKKTKN